MAKLGRQLSVEDVVVTADGTGCAAADGTITGLTGTGSTVWATGDTLTVEFTCTFTGLAKTGEEVEVVYTKIGSDLTHTINGQVAVSVQE